MNTNETRRIERAATPGAASDSRTQRYVGHRLPNPSTHPEPGQADWLTAREACAFADITYKTLTQWREGGLLPDTRTRNQNHYTYARHDIVRVLRTPRRGRAGVDRAAVLSAIAATRQARFVDESDERTDRRSA